jgi:hypothetical protein
LSQWVETIAAEISVPASRGWVTECENILTALGIPYSINRMTCPLLQLPDTYIVYFAVDDPPMGHYDNEETSHETRIQVSLFYRDNTTFLTVPDQIESAFMADNFLRVGSGNIPYDVDTGHNGWRCDFRFYERR